MKKSVIIVTAATLFTAGCGSITIPLLSACAGLATSLFKLDTAAMKAYIEFREGPQQCPVTLPASPSTPGSH